MARDPYQELGVSRTASADEIRKVNGLAAGEEVAPNKTIKIPPSM